MTWQVQSILTHWQAMWAISWVDESTECMSDSMLLLCNKISIAVARNGEECT